MPSKRFDCFDQSDHGVDQPLIGARRQSLGVVRDVGGLYPGRAPGLIAELEELGLGPVQKGLGLLDPGLAGTPGGGHQSCGGNKNA